MSPARPVREITTITLAEYAQHLQALLASGVPPTTPVQKWLPSSGRVDAGAPVMAWIYQRPVLVGERVIIRPARFYDPRYDHVRDMGELVIRV